MKHTMRTTIITWFVVRERKNKAFLVISSTVRTKETIKITANTTVMLILKTTWNNLAVIQMKTNLQCKVTIKVYGK